MRIEHGLNRGTIDLADHRYRFGQRVDHVALADGERLDQNRDAALRPRARRR